MKLKNKKKTVLFFLPIKMNIEEIKSGKVA
jgi:hypothetical protein